MSDTVITPEFRANWAKVFEPEKNDLNGEMEYSVVALFPKDADLTVLKNACHQACVEKWGPDPQTWPANLKTPFRDQSEKPMKDKETRQVLKDENGEPVLPKGYEAGAKFINLKTKQKPSVVDANVQPIIEPSEFYNGCYALASVRAYAYEKKGNVGVSLGLNNIQKTRDGESLGGTRTKPEDDFKPAAGAAQTPSGGSAASMFD